MKYNLSNTKDQKEALEYLNSLTSKGCLVEIIQKHPNRTLNQNSYLHLLLQTCALEAGDSLEYFKEYIFKGYINKDLFEKEYFNEKRNKTRKYLRSSGELTIDEMKIAIDRLIKFASIHLSLVLPEANQKEKLIKIENYIEKNIKWL